MVSGNRIVVYAICATECQSRGAGRCIPRPTVLWSVHMWGKACNGVAPIRVEAEV